MRYATRSQARSCVRRSAQSPRTPLSPHSMAHANPFLTYDVDLRRRFLRSEIFRRYRSHVRARPVRIGHAAVFSERSSQGVDNTIDVSTTNVSTTVRSTRAPESERRDCLSPTREPVITPSTSQCVRPWGRLDAGSQAFGCPSVVMPRGATTASPMACSSNRGGPSPSPGVW